MKPIRRPAQLCTAQRIDDKISQLHEYRYNWIEWVEDNIGDPKG